MDYLVIYNGDRLPGTSLMTELIRKNSKWNLVSYSSQETRYRINFQVLLLIRSSPKLPSHLIYKENHLLMIKNGLQNRQMAIRIKKCQSS